MLKKFTCLFLSLTMVLSVMLWNVQAAEPNAEDFELTSVTFTDSEGNKVTSVTAGQSITVKATVKNNGTAAQNVTVWVGVYTNDGLKAGKYQTLSVSAEDKGDFVITTDALQSDDTLQVHFWCGENKINAYAVPAIFPSNDTTILNCYVNGVLTEVSGDSLEISGDMGSIPEIQFEMQNSATKVTCTKAMGEIPSEAAYTFTAPDGTTRNFSVKAKKAALATVASGDYAGYFKIESADDFQLIEKYPKANYVVTKDITEAVTTSVSAFSGTLIGVNEDATAAEKRSIKLNINGNGLITTVTGATTFENLSAEGSVNGGDATGVGAFVGKLKSSEALSAAAYVTFKNCENHVAVTGAKRVGGFVGESNEFYLRSKVENCMNDGTITETTDSGSDGAGGFIGLCNAYVEIKNSYNLGVVSTANLDAGGLVGYAYTPITISSCYNAGKVSAKAYAGGLVGLIMVGSANAVASDISDCFNTGTVNGTQNGFAPAAGFVGRVDIKNGVTASDSKVKLSACYNAGEIISAAGSSNAFQFVHCKTGVSAAVENCYYLDEIYETSGVTNDATAKTGAELKSLTTTLNGADGTAWVEATDSANYPYPELSNMPYKGWPWGKLHQVESGTYKDYYIISSAKEFAKIKDNPSGNYVITKDITKAITAPLDTFSGKVIGVNENATAPEMRTVAVNITSSETANVGLFQQIKNGATFENLTLTGTVKAENANNVGAFAGITAGEQKKGGMTFTNCVNQAAVTGRQKVGGFIGNCALEKVYTTFDKCINEGRVTGNRPTSTSTWDDGCYIGGIIGLSATNSVQLKNSANVGTVTSNYARVGGLIGQYAGSGAVETVISGCYNSGDITGDSNVGGLVGMTDKTTSVNPLKIENSFNAGTLTATNTGGYPSIGGMLGAQDAKSEKKNNKTVYSNYMPIKLTNCYNAGQIVATSVKGNIDPLIGKVNNIYATYYKNVAYLNTYSYETKSTTIGTYTDADGATYDVATVVDSNTLKNYASTLGDAWEQGTEAYEFPVLKEIAYKDLGTHTYQQIDMPAAQLMIGTEAAEDMMPVAAQEKAPEETSNENEESLFDMVLAAFVPMTVNAAENEIFAATQVSETNNISVTGTNGASSGAIIDIAVLSNGKTAADLMKYFQSPSEGATPNYLITTVYKVTKAAEDYTATITMSATAPYGSYTILNSQGGSAALNFSNVDDMVNVMKQIVEAANAADSAAMREAMKEIGKIGADATLYGKFSEQGGQAAVIASLLANATLKAKTATDIKIGDLNEIKEIVDAAMVLPGFNEGLIDDIAKYENDICPSDASAWVQSAMADYQKSTVSDAGKSAILAGISNKGFETANDLRAAFVDQLVLQTVKYPANGYTSIEDALRNYASHIGISMTAYDGLQNENTVLSTLNAGTYTTMKELREAFNAAVTDAGKSSGGSYSKPAGGGGSSNRGNGVATGEMTIVSGENSANAVKQVSSFADAGNAEWAWTAMQDLLDKKILSGYGDNTLRPNQTITREEFIKLLVSAYYGVNAGAAANFTDVAKDAWYYEYVATAELKGITVGKDDGTFGIGEEITRQDMAVMICNCLNNLGGIALSADEERFGDDATISDYAKEKVYGLKNLGVISGYESGDFAPLGSATRAEAAQMIYNLFAVTK